MAPPKIEKLSQNKPGDRFRKKSRASSVKLLDAIISPLSSSEEENQKSFGRARTLSARTSSMFGASQRFSRARGSQRQQQKAKDPSLLLERHHYEPDSMRAKETALKAIPGLAITNMGDGEHGKNLIVCGSNSLRAEVLDMNTMIKVMEANKRILTHTAVDRFYAWLPIFAVYIERYFFVEEDIIITWIEEKQKIKGSLKTSARMELRGKIQRAIKDVEEVHDEFLPSLPAGERLGRLADAVQKVTDLIIDYTNRLMTILPPLIDTLFTKQEIEKTRCKLIKYVVGHVGSQDFIALYTRWMDSKELTSWKTKVLMPADFKYRSYAKWERDMREGHYIVVAQFAEALAAETQEDEDLVQQWREDFERAQYSQQ